MTGYSVWAWCDNPDWLAINGGEPSMPMLGTDDVQDAHLHARNLGLLAPAVAIEVRDALGTVLSTYGAAREERAVPAPPPAARARRSLGGRGRV